MKLLTFIINNSGLGISIRFRNLALVFMIAIFAASSLAQTVAILDPAPTEASNRVASAFESALPAKFEIVDRSQSKPALLAFEYPNPFNLSVEESTSLGNALGAKYLVMIRSDSIRRSTFNNKSFYEAYAAIFVIDAVSGRLVSFRIESHEAPSGLEAANLLAAAAKRIVNETAAIILIYMESADKRKTASDDTIPDKARYPAPYKRITPAYTRMADIYGVEATVDIVAEIKEDGTVGETSIVRWAGFGLEESVEKTVREMQWRPADKKGIPFTMYVVLRYNFRDLENPDN